MREKITTYDFGTGSKMALAITGFILWWTLGGHLTESRLVAAGYVVLLMTALYFVLRQMERASALRLVEKNWSLAGEKVDLNETLSVLEETFTTTLQSIAEAADNNDTYASGHSARVADFSVKIGKAMGLADEELESLRKAALFHDIGRIWIPGYVLSKEGPLNAEEQSMVRKHPVIGAELLDSSRALPSETAAVLHHHERFDGTGYPNGLKGLAIPLEARILAVADAFDAMTSDRPYRSALLMRDALNELYSNAGTQFDPRVVEAFISVLDDITQENDVVLMTDKHFGARLYSTIGNC
ncbi:HD-GYP domain-containing protein [Geobacter sp. DSM 9736]|uniref:HD-GYP domain-containing protein n=1 Tax=Geobacter sp. DSM 9736 TaxID=1277350 RepID=UPI000B501DFA|nr:HD-GYP domain-containing protein [Geobacter sp. DSM 9736]SNB45005.1 HDIG domain-containing protein [Geobacter sp. DSM 9736]